MYIWKSSVVMVEDLVLTWIDLITLIQMYVFLAVYKYWFLLDKADCCKEN